MSDNLPTDREHDDHHAHACVDCDEPFSAKSRPAGSCADGDLCQDCWEARGEGDE